MNKPFDQFGADRSQEEFDSEFRNIAMAERYRSGEAVEVGRLYEGNGEAAWINNEITAGQVSAGGLQKQVWEKRNAELMARAGQSDMFEMMGIRSNGETDAETERQSFSRRLGVVVRRMGRMILRNSGSSRLW